MNEENEMQFPIPHDEIKTEKIMKNIWKAKCNVHVGTIKNWEVTMQGKSQENAIAKLNAFLNNEEYSHL